MLRKPGHNTTESGTPIFQGCKYNSPPPPFLFKFRYGTFFLIARSALFLHAVVFPFVTSGSLSMYAAASSALKWVDPRETTSESCPTIICAIALLAPADLSIVVKKCRKL